MRTSALPRFFFETNKSETLLLFGLNCKMGEKRSAEPSIFRDANPIRTDVASESDC
jgi:hypothetical protein